MRKIKLLPDERRAREYLEDEEVVRLLKGLDKAYYKKPDSIALDAVGPIVKRSMKERFF